MSTTVTDERRLSAIVALTEEAAAIARGCHDRGTCLLTDTELEQLQLFSSVAAVLAEKVGS